MKRSQVNSRLADAQKFFALHQFHLPPFAWWTPRDWARAGPEAQEIRDHRLGWDVTDFGGGDFQRLGLLLFTLRNGRPGQTGAGKSYCEKIMMVGEDQVTPLHFHHVKTEDIINRGAGRLVCRVYNSDAAGGLADTVVHVSCDGIARQVEAGGTVILDPGQSITLVPGVYHEFHAEAGRGTALIGEVSSVNDDATDNRFFTPLPRFPAIEEDAESLHLLCGEYPPIG